LHLHLSRWVCSWRRRTVPKEKLDQGQATITADRISVRLPEVADGLMELTYKLVPEGIDLLAPSDEPDYDPLLGVFELQRDTLRIAINNHPGSDSKRPAAPKAGQDVMYLALKRTPK
jgi:hypothetical protein